MGLVRRFLGNAFRGNASTGPMPLTDEDLYSEGQGFTVPLIVKQYNNFLNKIHRLEQCFSNPILEALTYRWAIIALAKDFKFYSSHDTAGEEIMQDWLEFWRKSGLNEILMGLIPIFERDGHAQLELWIENGGIGYEIYGDYACEAVNWHRNQENEIISYDVNFTPRPTPSGRWSGGLGLQSIDKFYDMINDKNKLMHFTRAGKNYAYGHPRIRSVWSPSIMILHAAYADFFRKDTKFITAVPERWKKERIRRFMRTIHDFIAGKNKTLVYKMEQSPNAERTPLELPRFGFQSLSAAAPKPTSSPETGDVVRDPNWALIYTSTGLSQTYFVGNQAGTQTGSEVDLTTDDRAEIAEFSLLEPMIKKIINWFVENGLAPAPPEGYVIKMWKDWEFLEKQAAMMEREDELLEKQEMDSRSEEGQRTNANFSSMGKKLLFKTMEATKDEIKFISKRLSAGGYNAKDRPHRERELERLKKQLEELQEAWYKTNSALKLNTEYQELKLNKMNIFADRIIRYCMKYNINSPGMLPVQSSWVDRVGVKDKRLWFKFDGSSEYAGYEYGSHNEARAAFEGAVTGTTTKHGKSGSTGAWIWENIWAPGVKPGSTGPRPTRGGVNDNISGLHFSGNPFAEGGLFPFSGDVPETALGLAGIQAERAELVGGKTGLKGTEGTGKPFIQTSASRTISTTQAERASIEASVARPQFPTAATKRTGPGRKSLPGLKGKTPGAAVSGAKRTKVGKSITKHLGPGAFAVGAPERVTINALMKLNTASGGDLKRMAIEHVGWSPGNTTIAHVQDLVEAYIKENSLKLCRNNITYGNVMAFDVKLRYPDNPSGEYPCPQEWEGFEEHKGNVWLYMDLEHGGKRLKVGNFKYSYDSELKLPFSEITYDEDLIRDMIDYLGKTNTSNIIKRLDEGLDPEMSTEYYAKTIDHEGQKFQVNMRDHKGRKRLDGIAIVEYGNCNSKKCKFTRRE